MEDWIRKCKLKVYKDRIEGVRFYLKSDPEREYEYEITSDWQWNRGDSFDSGKLMIKVILTKGPNKAFRSWWIPLNNITAELEGNKNWIQYDRVKQNKLLELWCI